MIKEIVFPKLKYPLDTRFMSPKDRAVVLAYDCVWRMNAECVLPDTGAEYKKQMTLAFDIEANLANLGYIIEHEICKGSDEMFELPHKNNDPIFEPK